MKNPSIKLCWYGRLPFQNGRIEKVAPSWSSVHTLMDKSQSIDLQTSCIQWYQQYQSLFLSDVFTQNCNFCFNDYDKALQLNTGFCTFRRHSFIWLLWFVLLKTKLIKAGKWVMCLGWVSFCTVTAGVYGLFAVRFEGHHICYVLLFMTFKIHLQYGRFILISDTQV